MDSLALYLQDTHGWSVLLHDIGLNLATHRTFDKSGIEHMHARRRSKYTLHLGQPVLYGIVFRLLHPGLIGCTAGYGKNR